MHSAPSIDAQRPARSRLLLAGALLLICAFVLRGLVASRPGWQTAEFAGASWALTTAAHVAAMALLTSTLLPPTRPNAWLTCAFWATASMTLECFEHPAVQAWLMRQAPMWTVMAVHEIVSLRQAGIGRGFQGSEIAAPLMGAGVAFFYLRRMSQ